MLVLSSPSVAGKTTISRRLLDSHDNLSLSISATTRPPRPGEAEGKDHFFVAQDRFAAMVAGGELLEHAVVFGYNYGTPRGQAAKALEGGRHVLFDLAGHGTQQLRGQARPTLGPVQN